RIEPATGLIKRFGDEVRGKCRFELFSALAGIAALCEGHRAGVEPRVEDLGHAFHVAVAPLARQPDGVDERSMQVALGVGTELVGRADAALSAASGADPER